MARSTSVLALLLIALLACSTLVAGWENKQPKLVKEGKQGPAGPQGVPGAPGRDGKDGKDAKSGPVNQDSSAHNDISTNNGNSNSGGNINFPNKEAAPTDPAASDPAADGLLGGLLGGLLPGGVAGDVAPINAAVPVLDGTNLNILNGVSALNNPKGGNNNNGKRNRKMLTYAKEQPKEGKQGPAGAPGAPGKDGKDGKDGKPAGPVTQDSSAHNDIATNNGNSNSGGNINYPAGSSGAGGGLLGNLVPINLGLPILDGSNVNVLNGLSIANDPTGGNNNN